MPTTIDPAVATYLETALEEIAEVQGDARSEEHTSELQSH